MSKSKLDQVVDLYVMSILNDEAQHNSQCIEWVTSATKKDVLNDARDEAVREAKKEVEKEVKAYKNSLIKKVHRSIIIETIFLAFCVGIIVNQVTYWVPESIVGSPGLVASLLLIVCLIVFLILQEK